MLFVSQNMTKPRSRDIVNVRDVHIHDSTGMDEAATCESWLAFAHHAYSHAERYPVHNPTVSLCNTQLANYFLPAA